jgi:16S rRNA (cytosine1402-N4)-methyltransferase
MSYYNVDKVSGIFADLGVSSHQIDTKDRGFSFRFCADLDMRMNINIKKTAKDVLRKYSESQLEQVFKEYGDLFNAERIAHVICQNRRRRMINTTFDLKNILLENIKIPFKYQIKFLAKVFQALRIEVNNELDNLKQVLLQIDDLLQPKGRFVVLSYHSLEDRIVKIFFKENKDKFILITKKPLTPSKEEVKDNTRSRSAKLRIYEKI